MCHCVRVDIDHCELLLSLSLPLSSIMSAPPSSSSKIDTVQLDGLVLLKIINHCKESMPDVVSGQLLGLDTGSTLEITACYPAPLLPLLLS